MLILYIKEEKAFEQGKFTSGMLQVQSCSEYKRKWEFYLTPFTKVPSKCKSKISEDREKQCFYGLMLGKRSLSLFLMKDS